MPLESKRIAALLLTQPDEAAWRRAIEIDNILQKKTPATARRQATLIRKRLMTLDVQGREMITVRESEVQLQLLLAAAIKHSPLLGDFLRNVYALRQRRLEPALGGCSSRVARGGQPPQARHCRGTLPPLHAAGRGDLCLHGWFFFLCCGERQQEFRAWGQAMAGFAFACPAATAPATVFGILSGTPTPTRICSCS